MDKLKSRVKSLDEVEEPFKKFYKEYQGEFELQVEGMKAENAFVEKDKIISKKEAEITELKTKYGALDRFGDFDNIVKQLEAYPKLEIAAKGNVDEEKLKQMAAADLNTQKAKWEQDLAKKDAEVTDWKSKYESERGLRISGRIEGEATAAFSKAGVPANLMPLALNYAKANLEMTELGDITVKEGVDGVPKGTDLNGYVSHLEKEFGAHLFNGNNGGGAGGSGGSGGSFTGQNPWDKSVFYSEGAGAARDKIRAGEGGIARANALAKQAGLPNHAVTPNEVTARPQ